MKSIDHFQQNRPVHLARRDVYFEHAVKLLRAQESTGQDIRMEEYEEILFLLRVARQHAKYSSRQNSAGHATDEQFERFLNILAGNVKAVLSMLNLRTMTESSSGSFFSFLGANQASLALQAEEYQRRANDIIRSLHNTLLMAEDPFELLKVENAGVCTPEERERYAKAREHFTRLIEEGRHRYKIAKNFRRLGKH
ncbi:hypothetical protein [Pontiella agarivorans]|uniref:Uncharacterized protein n=1 Tax=Pontiella agarivorans TaxID=3038953 RepID=A0ABU5MUY7_9BACT|nr:hypothetical protein [Pontiella agarivorans]MDZ8117985.1 hypothetical protein [Pontiella agarivorans]